MVKFYIKSILTHIHKQESIETQRFIVSTGWAKVLSGKGIKVLNGWTSVYGMQEALKIKVSAEIKELGYKE